MAQLKEGSVIKKTTGNEAIATVSDMPSKVSELENDSGYVTNADLSDAGFGDMVKAVYDTNDNGIVDNAEKVSGFTVGTNVPANAKFTDTNTITTINGKTGAISKADIVALGIPAQDTVYTHPTTAGNKHMPTGGSVGQILKNTASGTATWQTESTTPVVNNLTETTAGKALDARQGKVLDDKIDILRTKVSPETALNTTSQNLSGAVNEVKSDLETHKADITSLEGRHGIRYSDGKLDVKDSGEWINLINKVDPSSWEVVQYIVRSGLANDYFSVGDQFVSEYDGGEITWEVIGIDVDIPADANYTHSMTLQTRNCLHNIQFDAKEPNNPDSNRKSYGNNRYIHSAVRQWLNSNQPAFVWKSQHSYDATPTDSLDLYNGAGFLYRLDPELVSALGAVNKKVARNTKTDGGGQDSFSDKVFLLSQVEVDLGAEGTTTGETVYPYYSGIGNAGRIKTLVDTTRYWWLRSPNVSSSSGTRRVWTSGALNYDGAGNAYGVSPACVII